MSPRKSVPLARGHAQRTVETDHLTVEIGVLDDVARQRRELVGAPEQLGERHRGGEALLRLFRQREQHGCVEYAGRNGVDADAELRELARGRQGERGDAALRGRVRRLPDLALESG